MSGGGAQKVNLDEEHLTELGEIFRSFDWNKDGSLMQLQLGSKELAGMIKEADKDGDGKINFQEFALAITSAASDNHWL